MPSELRALLAKRLVPKYRLHFPVCPELDRPLMFIIDDADHCEYIERFATREEALARLLQLSRMPWDAKPNRAPCMSWKTCGRRYELIEVDDSVPYSLVEQTPIFEISAEGVRWLSGAIFQS